MTAVELPVAAARGAGTALTPVKAAAKAGRTSVCKNISMTDGLHEKWKILADRLVDIDLSFSERDKPGKGADGGNRGGTQTKNGLGQRGVEGGDEMGKLGNPR